MKMSDYVIEYPSPFCYNNTRDSGHGGSSPSPRLARTAAGFAAHLPFGADAEQRKNGGTEKGDYLETIK